MTSQKAPRYVGIVLSGLIWLQAPGGHAGDAGEAGAPAAASADVATPPKTAPAAHTVAPADLEVLKTLHASNQLAIKIGKMGKDRAASDALKSFTAKMVSDHTMEDRRLSAFLRKRGLRTAALGPVAAQIPAEHAAYKSKTGAAYDHAFAVQMSADYQRAMDLVQRHLKETADDRLRPVLNHLLTTLRVLQATAQVLSDIKD